MTEATKGLNSYPKVYNLGHRAIRELFSGRVVVQEKVDGSQFSFGVVDDEPVMRSKRVRIYPEAAPDLFAPAAVWLADNVGRLMPGWTYRAEAMARPRHNTLEYASAPECGFVLFDIDTGLEDRMPMDQLQLEASRLGVPVVPTLFEGEIDGPEELKALLAAKPLLGGEMIEGLVIKNQSRFAEDGKMMMGKIVAAEFREKHMGNKEFKPKRDHLAEIEARYRTEARWQKAVQRMRDEDRLQEAPQDIGPLIKEVQADLVEEEADSIAADLYSIFGKQIIHASTRGLAEWYKERLFESQFEATD